MIKSALALLVAATFAVGAVSAEEKACCAKMAAGEKSMQCISFANLSVNAEQKAKLETWQNECMKGGCSKETHKKFLRNAKTILSTEQFAALKKECGAMKEGKRS